MNTQPDAPRLRAFLRRAEERPVLHMPRSDWNSAYSSTDPALVDIAKLPIGSVASDASVVATYAQRFSAATAEVAVVRLDLADAPNVYNTDKYEVWEDLPSHRSFKQMVSAASTEDNANLRKYLADTVFLVKKAPDVEHRLPEPPFVARLLFSQRSV